MIIHTTYTALAHTVGALHHRLQAYANKDCRPVLTLTIVGDGAGTRVVPFPGVWRFAVSHQACVYPVGPMCRQHELPNRKT